ncbi:MULTISPECIES: hypothetical protein [unclassified Sulfitobacter]|uniref:hypothetical protein n=1 Tax=unclassified Sulfitobacter TaxID=196795 RepID=UPI000AAAD2B3|nr:MULTISPECIES: hypothetical protein [unclassified Sulfitobacter]
MFLRKLIVFLPIILVISIGFTTDATARYRIALPLTDLVLEEVPTEPPAVLAKGGKRPQAQFKQAAKKPTKRTKPVATLKKPIGQRSKKRSVSAMPKATLPTGRISVSHAAGKNVSERIKASARIWSKGNSTSKDAISTKMRLRAKEPIRLQNSSPSKKLKAKAIEAPKGWQRMPSKRGNGVRYRKDEYNEIRSMPGNPNSPFPAQRRPYVKVRIDGQYYNSLGKVTRNSSQDSHIPANKFKLSKFHDLIR